MTADFEYKCIQGEKLPLAPIKLTHLGRTILTEALIDSGSALSIVHGEIGEQLGLVHRGELVKISGAGGKETVLHMYELDNELAGRNFKSKFGLPMKRGDVPYSILGRDGIFENFEVKFRQRESKFALSDY
jgi:hypothetical protein